MSLVGIKIVVYFIRLSMQNKQCYALHSMRTKQDFGKETKLK